MGCDGGAVGLGGIALVLREAVRGKLGVERDHDAITQHLGEDGRGGDVPAALIAFDDALGSPGARQGLIPVDEDAVDGVAGLGELIADGAHGVKHAAEAGLKNVDAIDGGSADIDDSKREGDLLDAFKEGVATCLGELFRVVECVETMGVRQTHGGGVNGPGEGSATRFVGTDEDVKTSVVTLLFNVALMPSGC